MIVDPNFQTPLPVVDYMVGLIPAGAKTVLEPSPGLGNIVSRLSDYEVIAADDFFLLDKSKRYDSIVMNPPFSSKSGFIDNAPPEVNAKGMRLGYYFLLECMKMSDNVIALMPWFTLLDSDVRMKALKSYGLVSLTALPRKTFQYARIQTCILELQKGFEGETIFRTFSY